MSTSQHSQISIVPGIGGREEFEQFDGTYEPRLSNKINQLEGANGTSNL